METTWSLSLPEHAAITAPTSGELVLQGLHSPTTLRHLSSGVREALMHLNPPGQSARQLEEHVRTVDGPGALPRWYFLLQELARNRLLHLSARSGQERLATLEPTGAAFVLPPSSQSFERSYVLSRFAWLRRQGDRWTLESPLAPARIVLHDSRASALVHALVKPGTVAQLAERSTGLCREEVLQVLGLLVHAGAVTTADEQGLSAEDADPALSCWDFHDLLFHARSRAGRHDGPVGAAYPHAGRIDPPPALMPPASMPEGVDDGIALVRPDLDCLQRLDPPFAQVQERRRSIRKYGAEPITNCQLGEFLYRVARVRSCQHAEVDTPAGPIPMDFALRPFPSGGGLYELDVYAAVASCQGLSPGLYRYDGLGHRLVRCAGPAPAVEQLLGEAAQAAGLELADLQVLLVLAARLPRVAWKYSGLAYALVLKNVGVLLQTMYLAATAMRLAPCALGMGNSDLFARAAGSNYYAESSVGEFLLGSTGIRSQEPGVRNQESGIRSQ